MLLRILERFLKADTRSRRLHNHRSSGAFANNKGMVITYRRDAGKNSQATSDAGRKVHGETENKTLQKLSFSKMNHRSHRLTASPPHWLDGEAVRW